LISLNEHKANVESCIACAMRLGKKDGYA